MNLYWISWYQPTKDCRPLSCPPNEAVLGWWRTGQDITGRWTLCAWALAESEDAAREAVLRDWPEAEDWRFCEQRERAEESSRFPLTDWMRERMTYNAGAQGRT